MRDHQHRVASQLFSFVFGVSYLLVLFSGVSYLLVVFSVSDFFHPALFAASDDTRDDTQASSR